MSAKLFALPLALGLLGTIATADAAPASSPGTGAALKTDASAVNLLENVTWRRCWREGRHTYCARSEPRVYSFYYAQPRAYGYYGWGYRRWR